MPALPHHSQTPRTSGIAQWDVVYAKQRDYVCTEQVGQHVTISGSEAISLVQSLESYPVTFKLFP